MNSFPLNGRAFRIRIFENGLTSSRATLSQSLNGTLGEILNWE